MDDVGPVQGGEAMRDLPDDGGGLGLVVPGLGDDAVEELAAGAELEDEVDAGGVLADVEEVDDVGVGGDVLDDLAHDEELVGE